MQNGRFFKDYGWQSEAVSRYLENVDTFYSSERGKFQRAFVVQVSPSGGKTIFSMKAAVAMIEAGHIDKAVWVVPRNSIKIGFEEDCKIVDVDERYQLVKCPHLRIETDLRSNYTGALNNFHGTVVTYQALPGLLGLFRLYADAGRRLMFVFDEAHHGAVGESDDEEDKTANVWGQAMEEIGDIACSIIAMTGTPVRTDQKQVPHFAYEEQVAVDPEAGKINRVRYVKSDYSFTYKDAVAAGVARKLIIRNQDATVTADADGQEITERLSDMVARRADKAKKLLSSDQSGNIDHMLRYAKDESDRHRRSGDFDAAVIVIVASTSRDKKNPLEYAADRIRALFKEEPVTVESADGIEAQTQIRAFKKTGNKARWIVAKNMISEGTNIPRIRVVCILRDIKSQVFYEQLVHRATRNDSDEVAQDAIVVQWRLPDLFRFGKLIEDQTNLIVVHPKPKCPACSEELEFKPRHDAPCPCCGFVPEVGGGEGTTFDYTPITAIMDGEEVVQGGDDFSRYDPISRQIFDRLGPNPRYGGRDGINEILRLADTSNFMVMPEEGKPQTPLFGVDEQMDRCWEVGRSNCKKAGGLLSRKQGIPYDEAVRQLTASCKRQAGMGVDTVEKVKREYKDPLGTLERFLKASEAALIRASRMTRSGGEAA